MRQDEIKPVDTRWVRFRRWDEAEFQYTDHYVNLRRAGIAPGTDHAELLGHDPPFVIVEAEVKEI